ncbi:hypothetical protein [Streptomyces sp. MNP-20]|nr:hypothetical protein [Streptomyces sp. MNP-20]
MTWLQILLSLISSTSSLATLVVLLLILRDDRRTEQAPVWLPEQRSGGDQ